MTFKFGDVRRNLKTKGFVEEQGDHKFLYLYYKGKRTHIYTKCSHGKDREDVGNSLVSAMKSQLNLQNRKQVEDLVKCPMSLDTYLELLVEAGVLPE